MDTFAQAVYAIASLASAGAGVLAWVAKIRWSEEFRTAKEAELKAKDQQIQLYRDMSSKELIEDFKSVREALEKALEESKERLRNSQREAEAFQSKIRALKKSNASTVQQYKNLLEQYQALSEQQAESAKRDYQSRYSEAILIADLVLHKSLSIPEKTLIGSASQIDPDFVSELRGQKVVHQERLSK